MKSFYKKILFALTLSVIALVPQVVSAAWEYGNFAIPYTVSAPVPTVSISVSPTSVVYGGASTLYWSSTNATSCSASGSWSGGVSLSGSSGTGALYSSPTYSITCSGAGGSASASATVSVAAPAAPTVSITASPTSVAYGGASTLSWSSSNTTSCTASGSWSGGVSLSGSSGTGALYSSPTYSITCSGPGGNASASATVNVDAPIPVPTVAVSVSPTSVAYGGASTIYWSSTNATSCTAGGHWSGAKPLSGSGGTGALYGSPTYTLTCYGAGGSASASATVTVGSPVPTVSLTISPTSVYSGQQALLSWSSTNATSCNASNYWSGAKPLSGSGYTQVLYETSTFTLTCYGAGGSAEATAMVSVGPPPQPSVWFSASPSSILRDGSSVLYWSSENVTSCTAGGHWSGAKAVSGSQSTGALTSDRAYSITCTGPYGSTSANATVSVVIPAPTLTLSASSEYVAYGGSTQLSYSAQNVNSCTRSGGGGTAGSGGPWDGSHSVSGGNYSNSFTMENMVASKQFTVTCSGDGGTATRSVVVNVEGTPQYGDAKTPWWKEF